MPKSKAAIHRIRGLQSCRAKSYDERETAGRSPGQTQKSICYGGSDRRDTRLAYACGSFLRWHDMGFYSGRFVHTEDPVDVEVRFLRNAMIKRNSSIKSRTKSEANSTLDLCGDLIRRDCDAAIDRTHHPAYPEISSQHRDFGNLGHDRAKAFVDGEPPRPSSVQWTAPPCLLADKIQDGQLADIIYFRKDSAAILGRIPLRASRQ
ncbi:hypothetical protein ACVMBZ_004887 [Bradyrhizobium liaoningense]